MHSAPMIAVAETAGKSRSVFENDTGRIYDKFRDRVMFPIHDRRDA